MFLNGKEGWMPGGQEAGMRGGLKAQKLECYGAKKLGSLEA